LEISGFEQSRFAKRNPEEVSDDIIDLLGCDLEDIIHASGKKYISSNY
jgi:hypothetical protein